MHDLGKGKAAAVVAPSPEAVSVEMRGVEPRPHEKTMMGGVEKLISGGRVAWTINALLELGNRLPHCVLWMGYPKISLPTKTSCFCVKHCLVLNRNMLFIFIQQCLLIGDV